MTPRLRILSIGLALSLGYAIFDYIERNRDKKPTITKSKKPNKRPGTARVSKTRAADLRKRIDKRNKEKTTGNENFIPQEEFLPISEAIKTLDGWSRNPFVEVYETPAVIRTNTNQIIEEQPVFTSLDGLNIETAVRMGEKAFVTINGETFTEGDLINNALIEKIENEQITFRIGKTMIIKPVSGKGYNSNKSKIIRKKTSKSSKSSSGRT